MIECNGVGVVQEAALDTRLHPEGRQESHVSVTV